MSSLCINRSSLIMEQGVDQHSLPTLFEGNCNNKQPNNQDVTNIRNENDAKNEIKLIENMDAMENNNNNGVVIRRSIAGNKHSKWRSGIPCTHIGLDNTIVTQYTSILSISQDNLNKILNSFNNNNSNNNSNNINSSNNNNDLNDEVFNNDVTKLTDANGDHGLMTDRSGIKEQNASTNEQSIPPCNPAPQHIKSFPDFSSTNQQTTNFPSTDASNVTTSVGDDTTTPSKSLKSHTGITTSSMSNSFSTPKKLRASFDDERDGVICHDIKSSAFKRDFYRSSNGKNNKANDGNNNHNSASRASYMSNSSRSSSSSNRKLRPLSSLGNNKRESSDSIISRMDECAHFHYETVDFDFFELSLVEDNFDDETSEKWLSVKVATKDTSWKITKTYMSVHCMDEQLHSCIFTRKFSLLPQLTACLLEDQGPVRARSKICTYFDRLAILPISKVNCSRILSWMEMDNKGRRVAINNDINVPAIAAGHTVRNYVAQSNEELSINVGDILSIIDKPPMSESCWWKGKKDLEVGFFPSECVELFESGNLPTSLALKCPYNKNSSLGKKNKLKVLLSTFFNNRPNRSSLKRTGIVKERLFGCDLGEHLLNSGEDVPNILKTCAQVLETQGVIDGIYRLSGAASTINKLRNEFDAGKVPPLCSPHLYNQDIHSISSLLKMYFRELPNPLLTYQLYDQFISAIMEKDEEQRHLKVCDVVKQLPPPHYRTACYLFQHLHRMQQHHPTTNMHCKNLAIVWAPNLIRSKELEQLKCNDAALKVVGIQAVVSEFLIRNVHNIFVEENLSVDDGTVSRRDETMKGRLGSCSQAVSSPKLLSLEEAQERHSLSSIRRNRSGDEGVRFVLSEVVPTRSESKYLRYHTVIELPKDRKRLKEKLPSPSRLRSFFRRSQSSSFKTDLKNDKGTPLKDKQKQQSSSLRLATHNKNLSTSVLLGNNNSVTEDTKRLSSSCDLSPSILQAMSRPHHISGKKNTTRSLPFFENNDTLSDQKSSSLESKNKKLKKSTKKEKKAKKEAFDDDVKTSKNNKLSMKLFSSMRQQQQNNKNNSLFASQRRKCGSGSESNDLVDKQLRLATLINTDSTSHHIHNNSSSYSYTNNNKILFPESNDNSFCDFNNEIDLSFVSETANNTINKNTTLISNSDVDSPSKSRWKKKKKSIVKFRTSSFSSGNDNDEEEEDDDYKTKNKEYKQLNKVNKEINNSTAASDTQSINTCNKINDEEEELDEPVLIDEDANVNLNASFHESIIKNNTDKLLRDFAGNISASSGDKTSIKNVNNPIQPSAYNTQSTTSVSSVMSSSTTIIPYTEASVIKTENLKSPHLPPKLKVERQKSADLLNWQIVKNIDCNLYKELSPEWNALFNKTFLTPENNTSNHQESNNNQGITDLSDLINHHQADNVDDINTVNNNSTTDNISVINDNININNINNNSNNNTNNHVLNVNSKVRENKTDCDDTVSSSQHPSTQHNNLHSNMTQPNNLSILDKALDILEQVSNDKIDDETKLNVKSCNVPITDSLYNNNDVENVNDNQHLNNDPFKIPSDNIFSSNSKDVCKAMRDKYLKRNSIHLCLEEPRDSEQKQKRLLTPQHEHLTPIPQQEVLSDAALDLFSFDRMYSHETSSISATPPSSHQPFQSFSTLSAPQPASPLYTFSAHLQEISHPIQPPFSLHPSSDASCIPVSSHDHPTTPDLVVCNDESLIRRLVSLTSPLRDNKNRATVMLPVGGAALQHDEGGESTHLNNQHDDGDLFTNFKRHPTDRVSLHTSNQLAKNHDVKGTLENHTKENFFEQLKLSEQQKYLKSREQQNTKKNNRLPSTQNSKETQNSPTKSTESLNKNKLNHTNKTNESNETVSLQTLEEHGAFKANKALFEPPATEPLKRKDVCELVHFDNSATNKNKFFNQYIESLEKRDSSSRNKDLCTKLPTKNIASPHITSNMYICSETLKQAEQQSNLFQKHLESYKEQVAMPSLSHPWLDSFGNSSVRLTSKELREWQEKYLQEQQSKQHKPQRKIPKLKCKDKQLKSKLHEKTVGDVKNDPAACAVNSENPVVNEKCNLGKTDKLKTNITNKSSSNQTTQHHSNEAVSTGHKQVCMPQNTSQSHNLQEFQRVSSQQNEEEGRQHTNKVSEKRQLFDRH